MPRRLDSVNQGGYVEAIDVVDSELEFVVDMLDITDARQSEIARDRIYAALEDLKTARSRTAKAKTIREDLRDLVELAEVTNSERMTAPLRRTTDVLESLEANNPVLHRRLKWLFPGRQLRDRITSLQEAEEATFAIGREINTRISVLADEIGSEDGRGRPADTAALKFASSLYDIWCEFTEGHTSRQNAPDRQKDPFGDFVEAAGKLIDPDFKGHHLARQIHEARQSLGRLVPAHEFSCSSALARPVPALAHWPLVGRW